VPPNHPTPPHFLFPKWAWSGSCEQFLQCGLGKVRHSKSSVYRCYQRRRSACGLHLRWSSASWLNAQVYYTLVDCNPLTPLLRFVSDLLYKLYLHCYAAVGKNSRGPSAVAELLVTKRDVTQWQFPPPPVTKCHTLSDPSPLWALRDFWMAPYFFYFYKNYLHGSQNGVYKIYFVTVTKTSFYTC